MNRRRTTAQAATCHFHWSRNNVATHTYIQTAWLAVFMNENANSCRSLATCRMRNARRAATVGGRKIKRRVNWRRLAGGAVGCQRSTWSCATGNTNTPPHLASSLRALSVTLCVKNIISLAARRARRQQTSSQKERVREYAEVSKRFIVLIFLFILHCTLQKKRDNSLGNTINQIV